MKRNETWRWNILFLGPVWNLFFTNGYLKKNLFLRLSGKGSEILQMILLVSVFSGVQSQCYLEKKELLAHVMALCYHLHFFDLDWCCCCLMNLLFVMKLVLTLGVSISYQAVWDMFECRMVVNDIGDIPARTSCLGWRNEMKWHCHCNKTFPMIIVDY